MKNYFRTPKKQPLDLKSSVSKTVLTSIESNRLKFVNHESPIKQINPVTYRNKNSARGSSETLVYSGNQKYTTPVDPYININTKILKTINAM